MKIRRIFTIKEKVSELLDSKVEHRKRSQFVENAILDKLGFEIKTIPETSEVVPILELRFKPEGDISE